MTQVGITTDGVKVMSGIAKIYFQDGLPLSVLFDQCIKNNIMPSWNHLYSEMKDNGFSDKRIYHLLHEHVFESYGKEFRDIVLSKLNLRDSG